MARHGSSDIYDDMNSAAVTCLNGAISDKELNLVTGVGAVLWVCDNKQRFQA